MSLLVYAHRQKGRKEAIMVTEIKHATSTDFYLMDELLTEEERIQFGKPLASFQIIQNKLANMLANVTTMQLLCL